MIHFQDKPVYLNISECARTKYQMKNPSISQDMDVLFSTNFVYIGDYLPDSWSGESFHLLTVNTLLDMPIDPVHLLERFCKTIYPRSSRFVFYHDIYEDFGSSDELDDQQIIHYTDLHHLPIFFQNRDNLYLIAMKNDSEKMIPIFFSEKTIPNYESLVVEPSNPIF